MDWLRRTFGRRDLYNDLAEEMREHLEEKTEQLIREGVPRNEAEQAARRAFGNATLIELRSREVWQWPTLEALWADAKYALRQLARSPGFAVTVILTLALGIGANTAVFGVLNSVLLRPLPFSQPDRLFRIVSVKNGNPIGPSPPDARDFSLQDHTFGNIAVYDAWRKNVATSKVGDTPEQHIVGLTSADFFAVLDIHPVLGRMFTAQEGEPGHNRVALITESFWQSHYGRSPGVLGQLLIINSVPYSIVGVVPDAVPDWFWARGVPIQVFEPFLPGPGVWEEASRGSRDYPVIGRLRAGVTVQQAQADLATIAANLATAHPIDHGFTVALQPLVNLRGGELKPSLLLLMAAVTLILFIACSKSCRIAPRAQYRQTARIRIAGSIRGEPDDTHPPDPCRNARAFFPGRASGRAARVVLRNGSAPRTSGHSSAAGSACPRLAGVAFCGYRRCRHKPSLWAGSRSAEHAHQLSRGTQRRESQQQRTRPSVVSQMPGDRATRALSDVARRRRTPHPEPASSPEPELRITPRPRRHRR